MLRILVTGARGFIARHTLQPLADHGFDVHALTSHEELSPADTRLPVTWHVGDLLTPGTARALIEDVRPTHVLHSAWITQHGVYWSSDENLRWLAATAELIHAFARNDGERFVNFGTCAEYDWGQGYLTEGTTLEVPNTLYGTCKLAAHKILIASAKQFEFSAASGRVFFCYGPGESEQRIIPHACRMLAKKAVAEFSSGKQIRDFMHVGDIGLGFVALINSDIFGACNVSSGQPVALESIVNILGEISGAPECIKLGALPDRENDPPMIVGDNLKLRSCGWSPKISLEEGLQRTYDWWRKYEPG